METITITFGDQGENHVGMEKIGEPATSGFTVEELEMFGGELETIARCKCEHHLLNQAGVESEPASLLIIRNGVKLIGVCPNELFQELRGLQWDEKCFMYGRVVNKKARYNLLFSDKSQEPKYEEKKGRIVAYESVSLLDNLRRGLGWFGSKTNNIIAEGNYYYDHRKCGIGWHGDSERKIVIGVRLGASMNLKFQWYHQHKPISEPMEFWLNHGDIYIMSEKAVGNDWKRSSIPTLRHSAGNVKYSG